MRQKPELKIVCRGKNAILYRARNISIISDKFLNKMTWPDGISKIKFVFKDPIVGEDELFGKKISGKYTAKLEYSAKAKRLKTAQRLVNSEIILRNPDSTLELKKIYAKTDMEFFYKRWRRYLSVDYIRGLDSFISEHVVLKRTACLLKRGKHVGLVVIVKWKDYVGRPVDWIGWVWIAEKLCPEERIAAHGKTVAWLKRISRAGTINAVVNLFNIRSLRFFRKIGFKPICLHISKER